MKAILTRLFNHEELTTEEARQLLLNISRGIYPEAQVAALLTVFQMRSITVAVSYTHLTLPTIRLV